MAWTRLSPGAQFVTYGFGQVEPNHLSAQRTGEIYAQLPVAAHIDILENGQFVKYDYAKGVVDFGKDAEGNTLTTGEWMLVFNEVKVYRDHETDQDFAMIRRDYNGRVYSPVGVGAGSTQWGSAQGINGVGINGFASSADWDMMKQIQQQVEIYGDAHNNAAGVAPDYGRNHYAIGNSYEVEKLNIPQSLSSGLIFVHIFTEHFPHAGDIRAAPPQISRRLKSPDSRMLDKPVRVYHNTGVHRIRLHIPELNPLREVLKNFGNHLTCRRSIGLDIGEHRIPDAGISLPVMIQNHDGACLMQKLRALCIIRFICIHNYQKRISVHHLLSLGNRQKHMWIIIRVFPEAVDKGAGRRIRGVNDNIHLLIQRLRRAADPDGRTETVNIKILMPHDNNLFLAVHELLQRMCLDSGLDPGILLLPLRLAPKVPDVLTGADDHLVSSSSESQIHGLL